MKRDVQAGVDFNEVHHKMFKGLYYFAYRYTYDKHASTAIADDVLLEFWRKKLDHLPEVVKRQMFRAALNRVIDYWREKRRQKATDEGYAQANDASDESLFDTRVKETELLQRIHGAVEQLPERTRQAILYRFFEGLSREEVAEKMGISVNTVDNLRANGLMKLLVRFNDHPLYLGFIYLIFKDF